MRYGSGEIRLRFGVVATLDVEDDGKGLPEDFEPTLGGGLGIRIVQELLRGQGGRLSVVQGSPGDLLHADFPQVEADS